MKVTRHLWLASSVVVCRHGALGDRALTLHGTASLPYPNEHSFHGIGGITHDAPSDSWTGISEGGNPGEGLQQGTENPRIFVFDVRWKHPAAAAAAGGGEGGDDDDEEEEGRGAADDGTIRVRSVREVRPGDGLKTEGIARVPRPSAARACAGDGNNATAATAERDPETTEYWLVSESNCKCAFPHTSAPHTSCKRGGKSAANLTFVVVLSSSRAVQRTRNGRTRTFPSGSATSTRTRTCPDRVATRGSCGCRRTGRCLRRFHCRSGCCGTVRKGKGPEETPGVERVLGACACALNARFARFPLPLSLSLFVDRSVSLGYGAMLRE